MNRSEAIEVITRATQWLTTSPDTRLGRPEGRMYLIREVASTTDLEGGSRGIYFGHDMYFFPDGRRDTSDSIRLVDHGNRASYRDYVPVTHAPEEPDVPLWREGRQAVDMRALNTFSDETLIRMANNAARIMKEYDHA